MHTLHDKHRKMVIAVNTARTVEAHREAEMKLRAWREGVADGRDWTPFQQGAFLMDADRYYIDLDPDCERPMCGGVYLDWEPVEGAAPLPHLSATPSAFL